MIDFARHTFHPVIDLPERYEVLDFTHGYNANHTPSTGYAIGKYDEKRRGMYTARLFGAPGGSEGQSGSGRPAGSEGERRDVHMGIDIGCPVGTPVRAFFPGRVHRQGYLPAEGDYGHVLVTEHLLDGRSLFALHGHLSADSLTLHREGETFAAGDVIGHVGHRQENGGWNPHLHFQLSLLRPDAFDLPGVVAESQRTWARSVFPDPRLVLGPLY
ncbi:MAG: peptidoglycan DD-metalloendopeptidase family protein [Phycisphaerae bacterium]